MKMLLAACETVLFYGLLLLFKAGEQPLINKQNTNSRGRNPNTTLWADVDWTCICLDTCVQCGHNITLTSFKNSLTNHITIHPQCIFTPALLCGEVLSDSNLNIKKYILTAGVKTAYNPQCFPERNDTQSMPVLPWCVQSAGSCQRGGGLVSHTCHTHRRGDRHS